MGAGRGCGKSAAGSRYVLEHVYGPPCDPRLPGGHRISIIAPTLGDALESFITGPSGLQVHDPRVKVRTGLGGTHVLFHNGASGKVFGAHTKADIERLRSGGNRCAAEGTMVRTEFGEKPIESIRAGERVWTRNGLRRVLAVWDNGVRNVRRYEFADASVRLTDDHKVWTDRGWLEASFVATNDTVLVWENTEAQSPTTACAGTRAPMATTKTPHVDCCTDTCGNANADPFPTDTKSTTPTTTSKTTGSPTSSLSPQPNTGPSTTTNAGLTGTAREGAPHGTASHTETCHAPCAEPSSSHGQPSTPSTADVPAGTGHHAHRLNGCAWCAQNGSPYETGLLPVRVRATALRSTPTVSASRVYDLTVEHDHEFFADGLLVSNCLVALEEAAAMRYLDEVLTHSKMGLRIGPCPHYVVTSTPKPRAGIIKLWNDPKTVLTKGKTMEAFHLPRETRDALWEEYGGTTLGRQELEGEILGDTPGALVSRGTLDAGRVPEAPDMNLIAVGFDPNGSGTGDESGIVAVGRGVDGDGYILADASSRATGREAALRAWALYDDIGADVLVVEENFGKSWLRQVVEDAWYEHHDKSDSPPIKYINAGTGKTLRAQPMAMRLEQHRLHIVGTLDRLEDQLATWVQSESPESPDRIDAAVHAFAFVRGREKARAKILLPHQLGPLR